MAIKRIAQTFAAMLILAPSTRAFAGDDDCVPDTRRPAKLVIENNTPCPLAIYFDNRFAGTCEPMTALSLLTKTTGKRVAVARAMCDTWGPITLDLRSGTTTTWTIDYMPDDDEAAGGPVPMPSGHHLQKVLGRHENEDGGDEGDTHDLGGDLHLDADRFAANLLEHQEQEQPAVHDRQR